MADDDTVTREQTRCPSASHAVGWAMHALEPSDEQAFADHLTHCAECTAAVEEVRDLMVALAAASDQSDPPARLRASVMDAVRATPQEVPPPAASGPPPVQPASPSTGSPRPAPAAAGPDRSPGAARWATGGNRGWRRAALAMAAVVAVAVGGGLVAGQLRPPAPTGVQADGGEQTRELLAQVNQPGATHAILTAPDGRPMAAVMRRNGRVDVVAAPDMPSNQPTTMYVLWGTAPGGPVALGSFAVGAGGRGPTPVGVPTSSAFPGYAVSVEPAGPLPSTPTRVVASGAVAS
jgi:anti-sigma factor RsiW